MQIDGSHHDWFGNAGKACLMNMVDDATGVTYLLMFEEETTEAAMRVLWGWIERYGIPKALYADRKNVYVTERELTLKEDIAGEKALTAFGKACRKLGIRIITARSPQAKGRVERNHGVYQDRFVKELALGGIKTIAGANKLLADGFIDDLNAWFAQDAASGEDSHTPVPSGVPLADVFAFEETRTVNNDFTIRHQNRWYQLSGKGKSLPPAKSSVTVRLRLYGSMRVLYRGNAVVFTGIPMPVRKPSGPTATAATGRSRITQAWKYG